MNKPERVKAPRSLVLMWLGKEFGVLTEENFYESSAENCLLAMVQAFIDDWARHYLFTVPKYELRAVARRSGDKIMGIVYHEKTNSEITPFEVRLDSNGQITRNTNFLPGGLVRTNE